MTKNYTKFLRITRIILRNFNDLLKDKMLALAKEQLLPTEGGLVPWNTETSLYKLELFSKVMRFQGSANMKNV